MVKYLIIVFGLLLFSLDSFAEDTFGDFNNVQFDHNYDADTINVNIPNVPSMIGDKIGVRIYGIDTPEIKGHCLKEIQIAVKAKEYVTLKLKNAKQIDLKNIRRDKYFRILADVYYDNILLSNDLIKLKYARPYFGDTKQSWCPSK